MKNYKQLIINVMIIYFSILITFISNFVYAQEASQDDIRYKSTIIPDLKILSYNINKLCTTYLNCSAKLVYDVLPVDEFNFELITDEDANANKHVLTKTISNYWTIRTHNHLWFVVNNENAKELFNKARKYAENKNYNDCINYVSKAIEIKPDIDLPYFLKAYCYLKLNNIKKFIFNAEKAILINSTNSDYFNQLAWVYATSNESKFRDPRKALQYSLKAISLYPDNWVILDTLAAAYASNGRFDDARQTQEKAMQIVNSIRFNSEQEKQGAVSRIKQRLLLYNRNMAYIENN